MFYAGLALSLLYLAISVLSVAFFVTNRKLLSVLAGGLTFFSVCLHTLHLVMLGIRDQKIPLTTLFEALTVSAFFLIVIYLFLRFGLKIKSIGIFTFPLIFIFQTLSTLGSKMVYLSEDFFRAPLFVFHALLTILGYAAFAYSMILGLMYLHMFKELKKKRLSRMYDRLPPLELLEKANVISLATGFLSLTVGIILGSVLAYRVWGKVPVSDPKILLSVAVWLIYVFGLLMRWIGGWSGRKMSYLSTVGFILLILFMVLARLIATTFHSF